MTSQPWPAVLRAAGWSLMFLAAGYGLTLILALTAMALSGSRGDLAVTPRTLAIQVLCGLVAYGAVTWAIGMRGLGLTLGDLRWTPMSRAARGVGLGLALGLLPALLAVGLSLVVGGARFLPDAGTGGDYAGEIARTILILAPAALMEELMFRGVAQVTLARALGRVPAIVALSLIFAVAHLMNPNPTVLGLANIALAGVLLGIAFYAPGGIWTAWGAHLGWNGTLAAIDAPVSGLPFRIPWIDYAPGGPAWLTGGQFGPEGGLLATGAITLAAGLAWRWSRKELA